MKSMSKSNQKGNQKGYVNVRGGFSERIGVCKCNTQMQLTEFDDRTRVLINNKLWDILELAFNNHHFLFVHSEIDEGSNVFCKDMLSEVFESRTALHAGQRYDWQKVYDNNLNPVFSKAHYNEILDLLEYTLDWLYNNYKFVDDFNHHLSLDVIYEGFNELFEKEYVGYRFIRRIITPITDTIEVKEIDDVFSIQYKGAKLHIKKAIRFLSDRDNPDYKNSIKESMSAVESICQVILDDNNAMLGGALKALKNKGINLHPALEKGYSSLYGYASDEGGIRHAEGLFESNVTFEEAKYMLVSCCAFVNYLIAEYGKTKNK